MKIEVTDNEVLNNILNLMKIKGVRQVDLARYLGISNNAISQWKNQSSKSYMKYLDQLADYFDVTKDEILHPSSHNLYKTQLSNEEQDMIEHYRLLPSNVKTTIRQLIAEYPVNKAN